MDTFQGRQLYHIVLISFWEGIYSKRKDCSQKGVNAFFLEPIPFQKGLVGQESKQKDSFVKNIEANLPTHPHNSLQYNRLSLSRLRLSRYTTYFEVITKTRLYNFDPLKPNFYTLKQGFTGVDIIFLISASEVVLTSTHNLCFEQKYEKCQNFFIWKFSYLVVKFSVYLNRHVFVMDSLIPVFTWKSNNR